MGRYADQAQPAVLLQWGKPCFNGVKSVVHESGFCGL